MLPPGRHFGSFPFGLGGDDDDDDEAAAPEEDDDEAAAPEEDDDEAPAPDPDEADDVAGVSTTLPSPKIGVSSNLVM